VFGLSVHPRYAYKHKDCKLPPPKGALIGQELQFTIELLQCFRKVWQGDDLKAHNEAAVRGTTRSSTVHAPTS